MYVCVSISAIYLVYMAIIQCENIAVQQNKKKKNT